MTQSATRRRPALPPQSPSPGTRRRSAGSKVLGGLGELFITLGVVGLLYAAWELWWTGLEAESDRQQTLEKFHSDMPTPAETAAAAGDESVPGDFEVCFTLADGTEIGCAAHMRSRTGPEDIMGTVYAPRLGDTWAAPIRHGTGAEQIDRGGVGHYTQTQLPDEPGNFALAGHRNTNASMLGDQDRLEPGDPIYVVSYDGMYVYEVRERHVVDPEEVEVLTPAPRSRGSETEAAILTLTTCHPRYSNRQRLIHHAELVDFVPPGGAAPEGLHHHAPVVEMFDVGGGTG